MRKKTILIPIYNAKLTVVYTDDIINYAKKYTNQCTESFDAFVIRSEKETLHYIAVFATSDLNTVVHESVHLVNHIFNDFYIRLDVNNDEPQAYLTAWIFTQINQFLNK